jgi:hypothetical protein
MCVIMPRKTFGCNKDEARGSWRKLNEEKLHNNII